MTGQSGQGMGTPGGADQQMGAPRWGGDGQQSQQADPAERQQQAGQDFAGRQQEQFDSGSGGQMGASEAGTASPNSGPNSGPYSGQIREHMEVIGADGVRIGTVDALEGHRIKLTRSDSMGSHQGHHHYLPCGLVAEVEGDRVRLSATGANAQGMIEER